MVEKRISTTAERLREAMRVRNVKQADLVQATGLIKSAVSRYVSGEYEPKQEAVFLLAQALNVSEMWLWGYDVSPERDTEQKKADQLGELADRLTKDRNFFEAVSLLAILPEEKLKRIKRLIADEVVSD